MLYKVTVFNPKSRSQPPQGHPYVDIFLSQVENELILKLTYHKADIK